MHMYVLDSRSVESAVGSDVEPEPARRLRRWAAPVGDSCA